MMTATRPIGLITHSKNFLIMHAPMTSFIREIMHEIILNQIRFVNILSIWQQIRSVHIALLLYFQLLYKDRFGTCAWKYKRKTTHKNSSQYTTVKIRTSKVRINNESQFPL